MTALGIELGSTRIKAVVLDEQRCVVASGAHTWENDYVDGAWTYSLDDVWSGVRAAARDLPLADVDALGVSAMMHGYLALDAAGQLLVPFRTWRNTGTGAATTALTSEFGLNIPHRWSIAHHYQAILDDEPHLPHLAHLTTLAGYVHWRLTGRRVLGIGDASGMFPVRDGDYDPDLVHRYDALASCSIRDLLPRPLPAGTDAGTLTPDGARLLDPTGRLRPGITLCPPEGDAGTGMVATGAITPRTGNVSAGTSIFAMVVLDEPLTGIHPEIDLVTTPAGAPVAMVHCNNGASELDAWAGVFGQALAAAGVDVGAGELFTLLLGASRAAAPDAGGVTAVNYLAGEPITGVAHGTPLVLRTPASTMSLANLVRAQLYGVFTTLRLGMDVLRAEGVAIDSLLAHGGLFTTPLVAQQALAAALDVPVAVGGTAAQGGAWGIALLAAYAADGRGRSLEQFLADEVRAEPPQPLAPDPELVAGYAAYLDRFVAALPAQHALAGSDATTATGRLTT